MNADFTEILVSDIIKTQDNLFFFHLTHQCPKCKKKCNTLNRISKWCNNEEAFAHGNTTGPIFYYKDISFKCPYCNNIIDNVTGERQNQKPEEYSEECITEAIDISKKFLPH